MIKQRMNIMVLVICTKYKLIFIAIDYFCFQIIINIDFKKHYLLLGLHPNQ